MRKEMQMFDDENRKPRGRAKSFVQRSRVRRYLELETEFRGGHMPRNFWKQLDKAVQREAEKLLGLDQGRLF